VTAADRLSSLAAGLCQDVGIGLEVHPGDWAWDPIRRVIRVSSRTLDEHGVDFCAGVVAGEVAHDLLTRHHLFHLRCRSQVAGRALLDALEDGRVQGWMAERYPGTAPWMALVSASREGAGGNIPWFLLFCRECAQEPARGWRPSPGPLPPEVVEALDSTRPARRRLAELRPSADLGVGSPTELSRQYRDEVVPELLLARWLPATREQLVQLWARRALVVAREEVLPAAEALLGRDLAAIQQHLACSPGALGRCRRQLEQGSAARIVREAMDSSRTSERRAPPWIQALAQHALESLLREEAPRPLLDGEPIGRPGGHGPTPPPLSPLEPRWTPPSDYDRSYQRVADQIEQLTRRLGDLLRPRQRLTENSGYPSGRRVDLRRLMTYEADPRRYDELWVRTTIPERRHVAVMLLVDLSGSMCGDKVEAALHGTILMAETLARLEVPFAIVGFQDVLIPLHDFHERLGAGARRAISEMVQEVDGNRRGGNNTPGYNDDGPCLLAAAELLEAQGASDRILVVVSDGLPAGSRSDEGDLHRAVRQLEHAPLEIVALGLGPDTEHVTDFYPTARASVPLHDFAEVIGELVAQIVLG